MLIGGTTAGTGYDQLQISGTATLGGTLTVNAVSGYTIPTGQTFSLLTYGSYSGSFATINNDSSTTMTPQYNSTGFNMLTFAEVPVQDEDTPAGPSVEERWAVVRATVEDRAAVTLLASDEETGPAASSDVVFVSLVEAEGAEEGVPGDAVWEDGLGWEDVLTLPLRLPLAMVEELADVVA
jgi:hypothetical protein